MHSGRAPDRMLAEGTQGTDRLPVGCLKGYKMTAGQSALLTAASPLLKGPTTLRFKLLVCVPLKEEAKADKMKQLTMCPSAAAGKHWTGLNGNVNIVCSALGNDRQGCRGLLFLNAPMTSINQTHLVSIPLASALPIVVILQGASTCSALM